MAAPTVGHDSQLGGALQFLFYDALKMLLLLVDVVSVMGMFSSHFPSERTRGLLAGRTEGAVQVTAGTKFRR
jgi:hypothetical protein